MSHSFPIRYRPHFPHSIYRKFRVEKFHTDNIELTKEWEKIDLIIKKCKIIKDESREP